MINIEHEGKIYPVPNGWEEVNLKTFVELTKLESKIETFPVLTLYYIEYLSLLGIPKEVLMKINTDYFNQLITTDFKWIQTPPEANKSKESIIIDDVEYFLPKDLNKKTSMNESITVEILLKDDMYNILKMASIFLRPKGEEFDSDKMEEREELFGERVFITDLLEFSNFFLNGEKEFSTSSKDSSEKE